MSDIGKAIDGEDQQKESKFKQFATDPRNLATLLVLGAALAQPRRPGVKPLGHALRAGVGALGFRGGLDKSITDRAAAAQEAESQQQFRDEQIRIRDEDQDVDVYQTAVDAQQRELDRQSRESIAQTSRQPIPPDYPSELASLASKMYLDRMSQWQATAATYGPEAAGPQPSLYESLGEVTEMYRVMGIKGLPTISFVPDNPEPTQTEVPTPQDVRRERQAPPAHGVPLSSISEGRIRKDHPDPERVKTLSVHHIRSKYAKEAKPYSDDELLAKVSGLQQEIRDKLPSMTKEEAIALKKDRFAFALLSKEQQKEVSRIARGTVKVSTPGAI